MAFIDKFNATIKVQIGPINEGAPEQYLRSAFRDDLTCVDYIDSVCEFEVSGFDILIHKEHVQNFAMAKHFKVGPLYLGYQIWKPMEMKYLTIEEGYERGAYEANFTH